MTSLIDLLAEQTSYAAEHGSPGVVVPLDPMDIESLPEYPPDVCRGCWGMGTLYAGVTRDGVELDVACRECSGSGLRGAA